MNLNQCPHCEQVLELKVDAVSAFGLTPNGKIGGLKRVIELDERWLECTHCNKDSFSDNLLLERLEKIAALTVNKKEQ